MIKMLFGIWQKLHSTKSKFFYSLILLFFISSCFGQGNQQAINLFYDEIELGDSSLSIVKKYGLSEKRWEDKFGNNVVSYGYSKPKYNILSFLPWQKTNSKFVNYEVILIFNQEGKLVKIAKFIDEMKVKSWLICENKVKDCFADSEILSEER